ncbi:MAG: hypothetical protein KKA42_06890 [candidate division Zixibacteria bacterium]|nr:hypothetical protein [candidate division Zixibacteria bacterium]
MKSLVLLFLGLCLAFVAGCGGDDDGGVTPVPSKPVVTAVAAASHPSLTSPDGAVWTGITPVAVEVTATSFVGKQVVRSTAATADSLMVQAAVYNDSLYVRIVWEDATHDVFPDRWALTEFQILGDDTLAIFLRDTIASKEDQVLLMFENTADTSWDVWCWRSVTTDGVWRAEGATFAEGELTLDAGSNFAVMENYFAGTPVYIHEDSSEFTGYLLHYPEDTRDFNILVRSIRTWEVGDLIPGWYMDTLWSLGPTTATARGSLLDTRAVSSYSGGMYTLVLCRALNTGFADDLVLTSGATINMRLALTNNLDFRFDAGSSNQGFTEAFDLKIP